MLKLIAIFGVVSFLVYILCKEYLNMANSDYHSYSW